MEAVYRSTNTFHSFHLKRFFTRSNLEKSFKKNIDGGYFPFLIVDAINEKVEHFSGMWSHAKQNGFEVCLESLPP